MIAQPFFNPFFLGGEVSPKGEKRKKKKKVILEVFVSHE
jgi:hypothetical protein